MKVILINPPIRTHVPPNIYPVGLCCVASYLQKHDHKVQVLDINGYRWSKDEFLHIFKKFDCDAVGLGGLVQTFNNVAWIANYVKSIYPDMPIFCGNTVASTIPQTLLKHTDVDVAVIGEGEETALELVEALESGKPLADVKGIIYKDEEGRIFENPPRQPIANLDSLPLPSWALIPMETYLRNFKGEFGFRGACISTVRGCPFNCRFCCRGFIGYKVRSRSPENIIEELKVWMVKYKIEGFLPVDDLFIYDRNRIMRFCDLLKEEGLDYLKWISSARADLVTEELALKMKKAGCVTLNFGFESHSQAVLDYYNKHLTVQQQQHAVDVCKKTGMPISRSYIVGARNETKQTLEECFNFCQRNSLTYQPQNLLQPQPQTAIYAECIERGIIKDEYEYVQKLSNAGDAGSFVVNVTENFSDEELLAIFHKYRDFSLLPNQVIINMLKDLGWSISRARKKGIEGTLEKMFKVLFGREIQGLKEFKMQPKRNEWT